MNMYFFDFMRKSIFSENTVSNVLFHTHFRNTYQQGSKLLQA